jgi:hypothetical protein
LHMQMASDFTVAWQFSQREPLFFVIDQTPCPMGSFLSNKSSPKYISSPNFRATFSPRNKPVVWAKNGLGHI